jgi:glycosyltransferase involved in cell wall biosynthesis
VNNLKTAIVHDWFAGYAGSERVVESLVNIFPDADIFSLFNFLNDEEKRIVLKNKKVKTSFIQKLPGARKNHRKYLMFFPYAIERFDLSNYDLIVSSSHAVAKGVLNGPQQLHICYCHTPIRYAWDLRDQYLTEANLTSGIKGFLAKSILNYIRKWDAGSTDRVDFFIANSNYISNRIKKNYQRESEVIYPPVDVALFKCRKEKEDYYFTASRMVPYKKIDLIVEAFSYLPNEKLIVAGDGPDYSKIRSKAKENIEFIGYQKSESLADYMQKAKAFVFAAEEDFGITVVEALSCGTPVIAFGKGGAVETVKPNLNGILFLEQTVESLISGINEFENNFQNFDPAEISKDAQKFDRKEFEKKIKDFVNNKCIEFFK